MLLKAAIYFTPLFITVGAPLYADFSGKYVPKNTGQYSSLKHPLVNYQINRRFFVIVFALQARYLGSAVAIYLFIFNFGAGSLLGSTWEKL